ncbi:unnamed protein product, partial [Polarella glacialis]
MFNLLSHARLPSWAHDTEAIARRSLQMSANREGHEAGIHICLTRSEVTTIIGMTLARKDFMQGLLVTDMMDNSVISRWNAENPEKRIGAGHVILSVNGTDNSLEMLALLRTELRLELVASSTLRQDQLELMTRFKENAILGGVLDAMPHLPAKRIGCTTCLICLEDLDPEEEVMVLQCFHGFHH